MWILVTGLGVFVLGVFLLLALLSPKGEERPLVYSCQRCTKRFSSPPLHPLPERYQEEDLCLCEACAAALEETIRDAVRHAQAMFLELPEGARPPD